MATTHSPRTGSLARQRRYRNIGKGILYALFTVVALIFTLPFFLMLSSAFKSSAEILRVPPTLFPRDPSFDAFQTVIQEAPYVRWFANSVLVSVSVTVLVLFTCSLAGYIFAKFEFPGRDTIFVVLLTTMMVPFPVLLIPSYLVVNELGLINSLWALIVPSMVSAFGIFLMRQFTAGIPNDLIDAARLADERGVRLKVSGTFDRREALPGADFVTTTIAVGGVRGWETDVRVPEQYGVYQTVGDSVGKGGVFRAMRHVPEIVAIARDMEELCPNAWLFNYTNPMSAIV